MKAIDKAWEINSTRNIKMSSKKDIRQFKCPSDYKIKSIYETKLCGSHRECCDICWNEEIDEPINSLSNNITNYILETQYRNYCKSNFYNLQDIVIINKFIDFVKNNLTERNE